MKISFAISLLVHIVFFTFLIIYKNEKLGHELISNVSVISQKYYDSIISKKPDINYNLIQKQPNIMNSEYELDLDIIQQKEKFINFEKKVLAKLHSLEFDLFEQNLKLQENQIPNIQKTKFREFKSSNLIQDSKNQNLSVVKSFSEEKKRLGFAIPILHSLNNASENLIDTVFLNNHIKYSDVKNLSVDSLLSPNKVLKKSEQFLDNKFKGSLNSFVNQTTTSPYLANFSNQLGRLNFNNINKDLVFKKYVQSNQNYEKINNINSSNEIQQNTNQVEKSLREWGNLILVVINSKIKYPKIALNKKMGGQVLVRLKISTKGDLKTIKILKSSGFSILDNEVLRAIKTTNYFPSAPKSLNSRNYTFKLPVKFEI